MDQRNAIQVFMVIVNYEVVLPVVFAVMLFLIWLSSIGSNQAWMTVTTLFYDLRTLSFTLINITISNAIPKAEGLKSRERKKKKRNIVIV